MTEAMVGHFPDKFYYLHLDFPFSFTQTEEAMWVINFVEKHTWQRAEVNGQQSTRNGDLSTTPSGLGSRFPSSRYSSLKFLKLDS
jgi:hypothetical protein